PPPRAACCFCFCCCCCCFFFAPPPAADNDFFPDPPGEDPGVVVGVAGFAGRGGCKVGSSGVSLFDHYRAVVVIVVAILSVQLGAPRAPRSGGYSCSARVGLWGGRGGGGGGGAYRLAPGGHESCRLKWHAGMYDVLAVAMETASVTPPPDNKKTTASEAPEQ
ncbi:unnamed protein product, partial [Ectocarpus sp. 12 AP-2014]